jgi:hypothetical protein
VPVPLHRKDGAPGLPRPLALGAPPGSVNVQGSAGKEQLPKAAGIWKEGVDPSAAILFASHEKTIRPRQETRFHDFLGGEGPSMIARHRRVFHGAGSPFGRYSVFASTSMTEGVRAGQIIDRTTPPSTRRAAPFVADDRGLDR